ncbi:MAG: hypothetical protein NT162_00715 [Candidatus Woesebacteria bacterium]|nr:hypothetical protein [Candidatus Woesebacteria bacterium]
MNPSPDKLAETPSCTDVSPQNALERIKDMGFKDLNKVPTGPGRDFLSTLVLIAKGYNFGGATFNEARLELHNTDWHNNDNKTEEKRKILIETGRFERFENN